MASVASASAGASPLSGYDFAQTDSTGDPEENLWTMVPLPTSSSAGPASAGFFPSPASRSMSSWAFVGTNGQMQASPGNLSPLALDTLDYDPQTASFPTSANTTGFGDQSSSAAAAQFSVASTAGDAQFMQNLMPADAQDFLAPGGFMFDDNFNDLSAVFTPFPALTNLNQQPTLPQQALQTPELEIPQPFQSTADVPPWNPQNMKAGESPIFVMEDPNFTSPSPQQLHQSPSASPPPMPSPHAMSPHSPIQIKQETGVSAPTDPKSSVPISIRKVRDARVQKRKSPGSESPHSAISSSSSSAASVVSAGSSAASSSSSKFLIVTPDSVNAHAGKPNPWECFEAMRPSQRGRKGPLASDTKENALQVRRLGACFCCHARKVKCDKERPCRNCKKLTLAVPQVVCWQFQDFLPVLFPEFIRGHFRKDEMARFVTDNIDSFTVDGVEKPCTVELFSGARFGTTLQVRAKFFTPKTADVLQHWHLTAGTGNETIELQARGAAPIGLDMEGAAQKDELKKKAREYIASIIQEPAYAEQVTDSLRHTELPRKILRIIQNYSYRCDAPIVKKALSIYGMHYVMTRHLCLTRQTIVNLGPTKLVPQNAPWVTSRVLNRQLKSVIDEMLMREMTQLFESFSKSLKPKSRKEWAPCLAAFLVLCLFMEAVETTADSFVMAENERHLRSKLAKPYKRSFALNINNELENLPFKQFAYQFHQIYQTHSKDASTRAFNPLLDDSCFEQAELDTYAVAMVWQLRAFVTEDHKWKELDFLTMDPILGNQEAHEYPRDVAHNYTGRLVAKFLLSFVDEKYIFGPGS